MATRYSGQIVTSGLVLALDASSPRSYSTTTWRDLSGNNYDTTTNNNVIHVSGSYPMYYDFNGTNAEFRIANNTEFEELTDAFSGEVWVSTDVTGVTQYGIVSVRGAWTDGWSIYIREGPEFSFIGHVNNTSIGTKTMFTGEIQTSTWYHVVYTYDGTFIRGYVNGNQENIFSQTGSFDTDSSNELRIGYDSAIGSPRFLNGKIGAVRLYNKALSAEEVLQNYNATKGRFD